MKQTVKIQDKRNTQIVAHRGYSLLERENTISAFIAACQHSVWGVECDIHVTSDGKYVVYHDDRTGRLCDEDVLLEETSFAKVRSLKMKETDGEGYSEYLKIPTLEEYLAIMKRYGKVAVIELKNRMDYANVCEVVEICKREYDLDKIVFISFSFDNLVDVRKILPKQEVMYLCGEIDEDTAAKLERHRFDVDCLHTSLTRELVECLRKKGIKINAWTCDSLERAETLVEWGVEYITSDILE